MKKICKAIGRWADNLVDRIVPRHRQSQSFAAEIGLEAERTKAVIVYEADGHMMYVTSYLPPLNHNFCHGDIVEITITKK